MVRFRRAREMARAGNVRAQVTGCTTSSLASFAPKDTGVRTHLAIPSALWLLLTSRLLLFLVGDRSLLVFRFESWRFHLRELGWESWEKGRGENSPEIPVLRRATLFSSCSHSPQPNSG